MNKTFWIGKLRLNFLFPNNDQEPLWSVDDGKGTVTYQLFTLTWVKSEKWQGPQVIFGPFRLLLAVANAG